MNLNYRKDKASSTFYNVHSDPEKHMKKLSEENGDIISYDRAYADQTAQNHPLMIMGTEQKLSLLQHPLCLMLIKRKWSDSGVMFFWAEFFSYPAFLVFLTTYILSSPGPLSQMDLFSCNSNYFMDFANHTHLPVIADNLFRNSD